MLKREEGIQLENKMREDGRVMEGIFQSIPCCSLEIGLGISREKSEKKDGKGNIEKDRKWIN